MLDVEWFRLWLGTREEKTSHMFYNSGRNNIKNANWLKDIKSLQKGVIDLNNFVKELACKQTETCYITIPSKYISI